MLINTGSRKSVPRPAKKDSLKTQRALRGLAVEAAIDDGWTFTVPA
ncbi:hypothetical protein [Arthrobacter globiformis]|nr:hypothetical protein [Arthrobacter globiformis]MDQ0863447.1 hypothetical protein [Arthrobacter globiformis]